MKSQGLFLRVDPALKAKLIRAAGLRGTSLSRFILDAAEVAASAVTPEAVNLAVKQEAARIRRSDWQMETQADKCVFTGVPSFFRACCAEATRGGRSTYRGAGYELCRHLGYLVEGVDEADLTRKIGELGRLAEDYVNGDSDHEAVLSWLKREFPRCMELVPARRYRQFLEGFRELLDDEDRMPDWYSQVVE